MRRSLLFALLLFMAAPSLAQAETTAFVYVSASNDKQIIRYALDEATGELTRLGEVTLPGIVWVQTVGPRQKYLYASVRSTKQIASYEINHDTGELKLLGVADAGLNPTFLRVVNDGKLLLAASYGDAKVATYAIQESGAVRPEPLQIFSTARTAHCIVTDHQERFAYVPHPLPNAIFQFSLDKTKAELTPLRTARAMASDGAGPRHLFFHPGGEWAYSSDESGSSCSFWKLDEKTGELTSQQTLSTLPADFTARNSCADVEVHPSGKFVYVSNRGHDSIAAFAIDDSSGKLRLLGRTPTEKTPRSFNITPSGKLLIAAGQGSNTLATYRLDSATGGLKRIAGYDTGQGPMWVQIVPK